MGFKDIRVMMAISNGLDNLHCKLYEFLESAAMDTAKMYSKDELEIAKIFARSITDKIYFRTDGFPNMKITLCIDIDPDEILREIAQSKPRDMNKIITSVTKGNEEEKNGRS